MNVRPPLLLVSVRDAREADEALAGGADWIDLKEPSRGALGAVDPFVAREVVALVDGRTPVSAAAGELIAWRGAPIHELTTVAGVSHLKLGLSGCRGADWRGLWRLAFDQIAAAKQQLVAVIYADDAASDAPPVDEQFAAAVAGPAEWILWDTFDKSGPALTEFLTPEALARNLDAARRAGKRTVVAGRLGAETLAALPLDRIDMVAVRGAACRGARHAPVCRRRVAALRDALTRHADCCATTVRSAAHEPNSHWATRAGFS